MIDNELSHVDYQSMTSRAKRSSKRNLIKLYNSLQDTTLSNMKTNIILKCKCYNIINMMYFIQTYLIVFTGMVTLFYFIKV
jgi:hypothetical protein